MAPVRSVRGEIERILPTARRATVGDCRRPPLAFIGSCLLAALALAVGCRDAGGAKAPGAFREHRYDAVPSEMRTSLIELLPDWSVGGGAGDEEMFFRVRDLATDETGRLLVYDSGNFRVQVFDDLGSYESTIGGREGAGPGEFDRAGRIAVSGAEVIYAGTARVSRWRIDGTFLSEHRLDYTPFFLHLQGLGAEEFAVGYTDNTMSTEGGVQIARIAADGSRTGDFTNMRVFPSLMVRRGSAQHNPMIPRPRPTLAADPEHGLVYVTEGDDYRVEAFDLAGNSEWAVEVDWERLAVTADYRQAIIAKARSRIPDLVASEVPWPDRLPALSAAPSSRFVTPIKVDGHGHLYVYPHIPDDWSPDDRRPVDVYDHEGRLVFSGLVHDVDWKASWGDYVYAVETEPATAEQVVARFVLREPF